MMRIIDLTQPMMNGMPVMDGIAPPVFRDLAGVEDDGYSMSSYAFVNHTGTHVDAPAHQIAGGATLDEIPLSQLVTEAVTIDLSAHVPGPVGLDFVRPHMAAIQPGDIVLFRSGNAANWGTSAYWSGWCYPDAAASAALVSAGAGGVGFDGPSADPVDSSTFSLHRIWLSAGALILENLAALEELPYRCRIVVAPLKVAGANGGPARIFAFVEG